MTSLPDRSESESSVPTSPIATPPTPEQRMFDFGVTRFNQRLSDIIRDLHDLADTIEREAQVRDAADVMGTPALIWSAQTVVHRVMWGLANLNLDGLVGIAGDTELARSLAVNGSEADAAGASSDSTEREAPNGPH